MRRNREDRQRANDMKTYRQAFAAIDGDGSGRVDPTEIVKFAARMGKRVDTRRFWRLFNELDIDNSAGTYAQCRHIRAGRCVYPTDSPMGPR
jgi:Ca2+-binding EF-hand superfamily protein